MRELAQVCQVISSDVQSSVAVAVTGIRARYVQEKCKWRISEEEREV